MRATLQQAGQRIGGNDLLIAAQAIAYGCTVVTDNQREFSHVAARSIRRHRPAARHLKCGVRH